ncbi:ROK family glucokinase [Clostridium sp. UBA4548]|uniref:ROK family glucokinase n=1 Tax=Clostridium sp. UBA4548 TaxID=1946361 RepID=UPI0025C382FC|nr:ROK family glucokinase [Clostridium sp. UBA4548]
MYVGVDLGGTNIAVGLVDENSILKYHKSTPTRAERGSKEVTKDIIKLINETIRDYGINKETVKAIGIGVPGIAEPNSGEVIYCVNLGWNNVPLKQDLEKELNIPVFVDNDATVAGLAEYKIGAMRNCESGVFITLGTGVGGGIVINGKVRSGFNGVGSEIGHMIVGENFYPCNCGRNGCLETFTSSTALINYTIKLISEGNETSIVNKAKGSLQDINGKIIFEAAKEGDYVANKAVDRLVKYLAIGITNIINIIDPEIIALGGGLSGAGDFLLAKVREEVERVRYMKMIPIGKIVLATLGNEAGIIGAAALGM